MDGASSRRIESEGSSATSLGAARQTINNAIEKQVLATAPLIKLPKVENARSGFFEDGDLAAVLLELPTRKQRVIQCRFIHDLRRTAARDFRRQGISEGEIMKLCGWKRRAMFDRYNIIDEADVAQAVAKRFNGKVPAKSEGVAEPSESLTSIPVNTLAP